MCASRTSGKARPRLHDLPSLQKLCASRFGWAAAKTLEVAQELYDGQGKKIITYPRAEVRYLPESLIADVPKIVAALQVGQSFKTIPVPDPPIIRRGANGHFHDKGLDGASHHAVIPNVNTADTLREVWPRLSIDEKKLFDVIARAYLAALMPDFRYRQTTATLDVRGFPFKATGRQPIDLGWRAAFPEWQPADEKGDDAQLLPPIRDGETAQLREPVVEGKETRPPPRYNEGTLIEAMQNAWRFVDDEVLRDRLKEAKGIGTPATRAEIIGGLKKQDFLVAQGKNIVPTDTGLKLFDVLKQADPALVDPGVTAQLECLLDDVVVGKQEMVGAIDAVCDVAHAHHRQAEGPFFHRSGAVARLGFGRCGRRSFTNARHEAFCRYPRSPEAYQATPWLLYLRGHLSCVPRATCHQEGRRGACSCGWFQDCDSGTGLGGRGCSTRQHEPPGHRHHFGYSDTQESDTGKEASKAQVRQPASKSIARSSPA